MRIRIDEIPEAGRFLHFHWDEDRLKQFIPPDDPFEPKLVRPVNVDLEIQRRTDHVRITGRVVGVLQVVCHRCLGSFPFPLDEGVDVFLLEEGKAPQEEELELDAEDMDYEFFDGEVIDIDQLIAEQIFLALPVKVLCSDNCKGLCPRCGVNLNEEPCKCDRGDSSSPFAKLKSIRGKLPETGE
jgi:uncharacterized protein